MEATYPQQQRSHIPAAGLLLLLAALAIFAAVAAPAIERVRFEQSHGITKHGAGAALVRQCLMDKGARQTWQNPANGRIINVCQLEDDLFGIQVLRYEGDGIWDELTAFVKEKFHNISQVERYLMNRGYVQLP